MNTRRPDPGPKLGNRFPIRRLLQARECIQIYTVWDTRNRQERVAKVLIGNPEGTAFRVALQEMKRHVEHFAALRHPHLLRIVDIDLDASSPYIIREHCHHARPLQTHPDSGGLDAMVSRIVPIAGALSYLHSHGITYRNVCPSNIILDGLGRPKLCNLGISSPPRFMAPEQRGRTQAASPLADQYALAATLYSLITAQDPQFLYVRSKSAMCWKPVPEWLRPILQRATQCEPRRRFHSVDELVHTLLFAIRRSTYGSARDSPQYPV